MVRSDRRYRLVPKGCAAGSGFGAVMFAAAITGAGLLAATVCLWHGRPAEAAAPGPVLPDEMTRDIVESIDKGLTYLANTQRRDGSWTGSASYRGYSAVLTSLAGMAMLANGSTPQSGPYSRNVTRAMNFVLSQARSSDGLIASPGTGRPMYGHGFSMLFLAQCYGMELTPEKEKQIHDVLTKAIQLTVQSQSDLGARLDHAGGWYYTPMARTDEGSVTVTQLQALRACRNAGIVVPKSCIDRTVAYLRYCQMPTGGICYSAYSQDEGRPAISAAALACFYSAGVYDRQAGGVGSEAEMVERLWNFTRGRIDMSEDFRDVWGHFFYAHFYYAQAQYIRGGEEWSEYYKAITRKLMQEQRPDGSWTGGVGSSYRTAIACIIMQLPYGYLPICQR